MSASNPFVVAKVKMVAALMQLPVPHVDVVPEPGQIESIADFVRGVARITDMLMREVGLELRANATVGLSLDAFQTPCEDAVTNALWDIQTTADELRAEYECECDA